MVDRSHQCVQRFTIESPITPSLPVHGCFNGGLGAHLNYKLASRIWSEEWRLRHINELEMEAVFQAINQWLCRLRNSSIMIATDNSTVVSYLNKGGGTLSLTLCRAAKEILELADRNAISVRARHIPGRLNVLADSLSQRNQVIQTEWSLSRQVANQIFEIWGTPSLDMFATRYNNVLPMFFSPIPDPRALATDALSENWSGMWAYAYPPFPLLAKTLRKVKLEKARIILIAPLYQKATWYPLLLSLLVDNPLSLPNVWDLLFQPRSKIVHANPAAYKLHAWRLSGTQSEASGFQRRLPLVPQNHSEPLQWEYMPPNGQDTVIGVVNGRLIQSRPLRK